MNEAQLNEYWYVLSIFIQTQNTARYSTIRQENVSFIYIESFFYYTYNPVDDIKVYMVKDRNACVLSSNESAKYAEHTAVLILLYCLSKPMFCNFQKERS